MVRNSVRWLAVAMVLGLLAAGCGSARDDGSTAEAPTAEETAVATEEPTPEATEDTVAEDDSAATDDTAPAEPTPEPAPDLPMFGDEPWPCGPGDASGETQQGVTDETIKIGIGDDAGAPVRPGLNEEMTSAVEAAVAICNEVGGIAGRTIETVYYDAALFNAGQVILEACDQVFMLVGQGWSVDAEAEASRVACEMTSVPGYSVSAAFAHGPGMNQAMPNPADQQNFGHGWIVEEKVADPLGLDVANSAAVYANYVATEETWQKIEASWPGNTGFEFPTQVIYNVAGEDDWTPFALELKNAGTEVVYYSGSCIPNYQGLRQAADVNEFDAIWTMETNFYEEACAAANTDGSMDDTYIRTAYVPMEEAEFNPATADFLDIVESEGILPSLLGQQAVSSFLLWATAASACGSELTSDCVLDEIALIDDWTGHGMHVATNPAGNNMVECIALIVLEGTEYKRVYPEEPATFACPGDEGFDEWVITIETASSEAALLNDDRISTLYGDG